jgi:tRNA A37 threonylcarbamoyltransferase TsaD
MCKLMCESRSAKMFCPAKEFLVDNGAMIAYTGEILFKAGVSKNPEEVVVDPRERTDMVKVNWK